MKLFRRTYDSLTAYYLKPILAPLKYIESYSAKMMVTQGEGIEYLKRALTEITAAKGILKADYQKPLVDALLSIGNGIENIINTKVAPDNVAGLAHGSIQNALSLIGKELHIQNSVVKNQQDLLADFVKQIASTNKELNDVKAELEKQVQTKKEVKVKTDEQLLDVIDDKLEIIADQAVSEKRV